MPWAAAAVAAAVVGGGASIYASNKASDAQEKAAASAQAIDEKNRLQTRADLAPYRDVGSSGVTKYGDAIGLNGPGAREASFADFRADPGYQYALDEGIKATSGLRAARGGYLAGGTLKALQDRGQGMADQGYSSYLDRFLKAAGIGENAAAQTGNFDAASTARQGGYINDAGAARAGGYLSAAAGVNGAISNGLQLYGYGKGNGWFNGNVSSNPDGTARGNYVRL